MAWPGHPGHRYFTRLTWIFTGKRPAHARAAQTITLPVHERGPGKLLVKALSAHGCSKRASGVSMKSGGVPAGSIPPRYRITAR